MLKKFLIKSADSHFLTIPGLGGSQEIERISGIPSIKKETLWFYPVHALLPGPTSAWKKRTG
jgi:hypothetical protein